MMGNFCHGDDSKDLHIEQMGSDACLVVGFNDKVSTPFLFLIQFLFIFTLTNYKINKGYQQYTWQEQGSYEQIESFL